MTKSQKRSSSSVIISKSAIDQATSTLEDLPEKPKEVWSLREAVALLQDSISAALNKGYGYDEVSKMLSAKGVEISASSLKSYLSAAKRQKDAPTATKTRRGGRRARRTQNEETSAEEGSEPSDAVSQNGTGSFNGAAANSSAQSNQLDDAELSASAESDAAETPTGTTRRRTRSSADKSGSGTRSRTAAKSRSTNGASASASKAKTPRSTSGRGRKKSQPSE